MTYLLRYAAAPGLLLSLAMAANAGVPVRYLTPDEFRIDPEGPLKVQLETPGARGVTPVDWPAEGTRWFFVRGEATQQNRPDMKATERDGRTVAVSAPREPGVAAIGLDTKPAVSAVEPGELRAFLLENLAGAAENEAVQRLAGDKRVRVRRQESITALVRIGPRGPAADPSAVAVSKTGLALEIRPLFDPTMLTPGSDLPVRLYVGGTKAAGAQVRATSVLGGKSVLAKSDVTGLANLPISHAGAWRVEFHLAEPLTNDAAADWHLRSATLSFEVPTEDGQ